MTTEKNLDAYVPMRMILPHMTFAEMTALIEVCFKYRDHFPFYCDCIIALLRDEAARRDTPGAEPGMIQCPLWDGPRLSDLLVGSFTFARMPFTETTHRFLHEFGMMIVAQCSVELDKHGWWSNKTTSN